MAMMDYGAIAFKNGKLISTEMFTPMIDMVGWEDTDADTYHDYSRDVDEPIRFNGNFFAYVGDNDCTVAFYKCGLYIAEKINGEFWLSSEEFSGSNFTWSKWERFSADGDMKVTKRNGYYVFKWNYKGNRYKVYFGFGVDIDYYKKCRIVNYYRSPEYRLYKVKRLIEEIKYDLNSRYHKSM